MQIVTREHSLVASWQRTSRCLSPVLVWVAGPSAPTASEIQAVRQWAADRGRLPSVSRALAQMEIMMALPGMADVPLVARAGLHAATVVGLLSEEEFPGGLAVAWNLEDAFKRLRGMQR